MNEDPKASSNPEISPTAPLPVLRGKEVESSMESRDRHVPTHKPSGGPREEEKRENAARSEEVRRLRREVERGGTRTGVELIERIHDLYQKIVGEQIQRTRAVEQRLKQTEELLATRSAELSEARTFLSTTDRLSEVEVLGIVRDLNEIIFQIAVTLTEEWEKLESSQAAGRMDIDPISRPHTPTLVQLARNRDLTAVALERIESMVQVIIRLESTFMVGVTSSDMTLLFETPGTAFDDARMVNDFGSDSASAPTTGRRDSVAGTTEVGVGKSTCGRPGETRRGETLLKTKVVLEKDVVGGEA
ncbi:hypothetical protein BDM02DRAFT_3126675 [Thelephora ganbajun]|uniref:Uncharacterized protein n=1 Tax=Thelephora ganbajun TaxID=370292 RepID=A0ACB6ZRJ0_THEGA|nr:hypothetical protein BDM02DRAFT_3126675 [Thelephora ganbajun]